MKRIFTFAIILCISSVAAFAAKNSETLVLSKAVKVGATQVAAGDYKVSWTGTDANVQVTFVKNGKTVATVPAKLETAKNANVSVGTKMVGGGEVLQVIMLNKCNLTITGDSTTGN